MDTPNELAALQRQFDINVSAVEINDDHAEVLIKCFQINLERNE